MDHDTECARGHSAIQGISQIGGARNWVRSCAVASGFSQGVLNMMRLEDVAT